MATIVPVASTSSVAAPHPGKIEYFAPELLIRYLSEQAESGVKRPVPDVQALQSVVVFADISGFTELSERFAKYGGLGAENLGFWLNRYFELLVRAFSKQGGDVFKFAGDAMLVVWPEEKRVNGETVTPEDLYHVAARALMACMAVKEMNRTPLADGIHFQIKFGVGIGSVNILHVGGVFGRVEYLCTGDAVMQSFECEHNCTPGQTIISAQVLQVLRDNVDGKLREDGTFEVHELKKIVRSRNLKRTPVDVLGAVPDLLRAYVPAAIVPHLAYMSHKWASELRTVTVMFVNVGFQGSELSVISPEVMAKVNEVLRTVQSTIYQYEGSLNKFLVDDKGSTLLAVLGLPPLAHENDPERAVLAGILMVRRLQELNLRCYVGVTSGTALCGPLGSGSRREYSILGDVVNTSARLMVAARTTPMTQDDVYLGCILIDKTTKASAEKNSQLVFEPLPEIHLKGKAKPLPVFQPGLLTQKPPVVHSLVDKASRMVNMGFSGMDLDLIEKLEALLQTGEAPDPVLLTGDDGTGKTALLLRFIKLAQEMFNVAVAVPIKPEHNRKVEPSAEPLHAVLEHGSDGASFPGVFSTASIPTIASLLAAQGASSMLLASAGVHTVDSDDPHAFPSHDLDHADLMADLIAPGGNDDDDATTNTSVSDHQHLPGQTPDTGLPPVIVGGVRRPSNGAAGRRKNSRLLAPMTGNGTSAGVMSPAADMLPGGQAPIHLEDDVVDEIAPEWRTGAYARASLRDWSGAAPGSPGAGNAAGNGSAAGATAAAGAAAAAISINASGLLERAASPGPVNSARPGSRSGAMAKRASVHRMSRIPASKIPEPINTTTTPSPGLRSPAVPVEQSRRQSVLSRMSMQTGGSGTPSSVGRRRTSVTGLDFDLRKVRRRKSYNAVRRRGSGLMDLQAWISGEHKNRKSSLPTSVGSRLNEVRILCAEGRTFEAGVHCYVWRQIVQQLTENFQNFYLPEDYSLVLDQIALIRAKGLFAYGNDHCHGRSGIPADDEGAADESYPVAAGRESDDDSSAGSEAPHPTPQPTPDSTRPRKRSSTTLPAPVVSEAILEMEQEVLLRLIQAHCRRCALVILLDHCQWMSDPEWALVSTLATFLDQTVSIACFLVVVTRPLHHVKYRPSFRKISNGYFDFLGMLSTEYWEMGVLLPSDIEQLVQRELQLVHVPRQLSQLVYIMSGGNPRFARKFVQALHKVGLVKLSVTSSSNGPLTQCKLELANLAFVPVPYRVQRVIATYVDRLSSVQSLILKVASVVCMGGGMICVTFDLDLLCGVFPSNLGVAGDPGSLDGYLERKRKLVAEIDILLEYGLLRVKRSGSSPAEPISVQAPVGHHDPTMLDLSALRTHTTEYTSEPHRRFCFSCGLLRDVVYHRMLHAHRQRVHNVIAEFLEGIRQSGRNITLRYSTNELDTQVVRHYRLAAQRERADQYVARYIAPSMTSMDATRAPRPSVINTFAQMFTAEAGSDGHPDVPHPRAARHMSLPSSASQEAGSIAAGRGSTAHGRSNSMVPDPRAAVVTADMPLGLTPEAVASQVNRSRIRESMTRGRTDTAGEMAEAVANESLWDKIFCCKRQIIVEPQNRRRSDAFLHEPVVHDELLDNPSGRTPGPPSADTRAILSALDSKGADEDPTIRLPVSSAVPGGMPRHRPMLRTLSSVAPTLDDDEFSKPTPHATKADRDADRRTSGTTLSTPTTEVPDGSPPPNADTSRRSSSVSQRRASEVAVAPMARSASFYGRQGGTADAVRIGRIVARIHSWNFDVFLLHHITDGAALTHVCHELFHQRGFSKSLGVPKEVFHNLISAVQSEYLANPFHCSIHAADVVQTCDVLMSCLSQYHQVSAWEMFAVLIAAAIHDLKHPGVTKSFLEATHDNIVQQHPGPTSLEQFHLQQFWKIIAANPAERDVFQYLPAAVREQAQDLVEELVMGTSVHNHFEYLMQMHDLAERTSVAHMTQREVHSVLGLLLKAADMSCFAKPFALSKLWLDRITAEYFIQGDMERAREFPVSLFMDRNHHNTAQCQLSMMVFFSCPLLTLFGRIVPTARDLFQHEYAANLSFWQEQAMHVVQVAETHPLAHVLRVQADALPTAANQSSRPSALHNQSNALMTLEVDSMQAEDGNPGKILFTVDEILSPAALQSEKRSARSSLSDTEEPDEETKSESPSLPAVRSRRRSLKVTAKVVVAAAAVRAAASDRVRKQLLQAFF